MPTTYTHYRMGQDVRNILQEKERKIVEKYPQLFCIGLHGPDIFFYYKPLSKNPIKEMGHAMHKRPGKVFFASAAEVVNGQPEKDAYLAYLYGFICHFALDVACHGYIDEKIMASGISHTEIEAEFDRMLMEKDGRDPVRYKPTVHIVPSMENAEIIQAFFKETDSTQTLDTLKGMVSYLNFLVAPSKAKRFLIDTVLKLTGNYKELHGLMINYRANPACADSTKELFTRYQETVERAASLIREYGRFLEGNEELDSIYRYNFVSRVVEEEGNTNGK